MSLKAWKARGSPAVITAPVLWHFQVATERSPLLTKSRMSSPSFSWEPRPSKAKWPRQVCLLIGVVAALPRLFLSLNFTPITFVSHAGCDLGIQRSPVLASVGTWLDLLVEWGGSNLAPAQPASCPSAQAVPPPPVLAEAHPRKTLLP